MTALPTIHHNGTGADGGVSNITMWRTTSKGQIERVECSRITETMAHLTSPRDEIIRFKIPHREQIRSGYRSYHKTWEYAHAELLAQAERRLASVRLQLERAQGEHNRIKGMKPPAEAEVVK